MTENYNPRDAMGSMNEENLFLKMKIALEHGAEFNSSGEVPPELENLFLRNVLEFEEQAAACGQVTVFEKLGFPTRFRKPAEIPRDAIGQAWDELLFFLNEKGIDVSVCSPNVSPAELYRFCIEELFQLEVDDISIPGMMNCFIYDEFYPDHKYDNTRIATEDCIRNFFRKGEFCDFHFADKIRLNNHHGIWKKDLKYIAASFTRVYETINIRQLHAEDCRLKENECTVSGFYELGLGLHKNETVKRGKWKVELVRDPRIDTWLITAVEIKGISF